MTTVKRKAKQLGQILIEQGLITPAQLEQALEEHRKTPKSLGRVLIDLGTDQGGRPRPRARRTGRAGVRRSLRLPHRSLRHDAPARRARPPLPRDPDRGARRQVAGGDVRPGERLRARRHPHDHEPGRAAGRGHGGRRRAGDPEVRRDGRPGRGARLAGLRSSWNPTRKRSARRRSRRRRSSSSSRRS